MDFSCEYGLSESDIKKTELMMAYGIVAQLFENGKLDEVEFQCAKRRYQAMLDEIK